VTLARFFLQQASSAVDLAMDRGVPPSPAGRTCGLFVVQSLGNDPLANAGSVFLEDPPDDRGLRLIDDGAATATCIRLLVLIALPRGNPISPLPV
jgi:hypothetical protein